MYSKDNFGSKTSNQKINDTGRKTNTYTSLDNYIEIRETPINEQREDTNGAFLNKMQYPKDEKLFRPYQMNIVKTCLQSNTLVCLPTGLGKTFIASVIIYNFHLWFSGKIFFFAPTKPLVNQQRASFLSMFKELSSIVVEMNGLVSLKKRQSMYANNKIFFMTPQTLDNDLTKNLIDCSKISLLIFDEAHKAQKKYSYTNIVTKISTASPSNKFRTVALSASPGSNNEAIQNVIDSLKIKNIELRTENDPDLKPFLFNKEIRIVEIQSTNDMNRIKTIVEKLITKRVDILKKYKIVDSGLNVKYVGKKTILDALENFKHKKTDFENEIGAMMVKEIYQTFSIIMRLLSSKSLLVEQGLESFKESIKKFYEEKDEFKSSSKMNSQFASNQSSHKNFKTPAKFPNNNIEVSASKKNLMESDDFRELISELFQPNEFPGQIQNQFPGSMRKMDNTVSQMDKADHPKLIKLIQILQENHDNIKNNSRVIIFTQFKDSAREILAHVQQSGKFCDIPFSIFTGQDKNFKQRDQLEVMQKFRDGDIKVLIATSVAEEGLDIGEVDLIICYDMASTSPIRMIQRFGRTGRKRNGCVIVLASKGEEKSKFHRALHRMKGINKELSKLKYDVDRCKIKFYKNLENVLVIPKSFIENVDLFDLENEVIENTEDIFSDSENDEENEEAEAEAEEEDEDEFSNKQNGEGFGNNNVKQPMLRNRVNDNYANLTEVKNNNNNTEARVIDNNNTVSKLTNTGIVNNLNTEHKIILTENNKKPLFNFYFPPPSQIKTPLNNNNQFMPKNIPSQKNEFLTNTKQNSKFQNENNQCINRSNIPIKNEISSFTSNTRQNSNLNCNQNENNSNKNAFMTSTKQTLIFNNAKPNLASGPVTPFQPRASNSKPLLNFTLLNKKTDCNSKYLTKSKIEDEEIMNINESALITIMLECEAENKKEVKMNKSNENSPIHLEDFDLDEILNENFTTNVITDKDKCKGIDNKPHIEVEKQIIIKNNNVTDNNDFLFDLMQRQSFLDNVVNFMNQEEAENKENMNTKTTINSIFNNIEKEMKENIQVPVNEKLESESKECSLQRQLFKPIENENSENIIKMTTIKNGDKNYFDRNNYEQNFKRKFSSVAFTPSKLDCLFSNEPKLKKFKHANPEEEK